MTRFEKEYYNSYQLPHNTKYKRNFKISSMYLDKVSSPYLDRVIIVHVSPTFYESSSLYTQVLDQNGPRFVRSIIKEVYFTFLI